MPVWRDCSTTVELYRIGSEIRDGAMAFAGAIGQSGCSGGPFPGPVGLKGSTSHIMNDSQEPE